MVAKLCLTGPVDKDPQARQLGKAAQTRLATNLRLLRKRRRMTQEELAGRCGLATRHLQKIEAGEVNVTLRTLAVLASVLRVELNQLLASDPGSRS
jgi:transcriptional regulator with XRE-family HTH domain